MSQFGSATAQDLYDIFIGSGALNAYDYWELHDDEDDIPVPDGWYVVVGIENDMGEKLERRRLHADLLWVAILACASYKLAGVHHSVADKCSQIVNEADIDQIRFDRDDADAVMQVALLGQVAHRGRL